MVIAKKIHVHVFVIKIVTLLLCWHWYYYLDAAADESSSAAPSTSSWPAWKKWMSRSSPQSESPPHIPDTLKPELKQPDKPDTSQVKPDQSQITSQIQTGQSATGSHSESDQSQAKKDETTGSEKSESARPSHLDVKQQGVQKQEKEKKLSDHCFIGLFWAIVLVKLWMNAWLLQLLPILIVFILLKKLGMCTDGLKNTGSGAANSSFFFFFFSHFFHLLLFQIIFSQAVWWIFFSTPVLYWNLSVKINEKWKWKKWWQG